MAEPSSTETPKSPDTEPISLFPITPSTEPKALFPISTTTITSTTTSQWLCSSSFTADLSVINQAVSSLHSFNFIPHDDDDDIQVQESKKPSSTSYEFLESSESDKDYSDKKKKSRSKSKKKRKRDKDFESEAFAYGARKSVVRAWAGSETKPSKDYYFDSRGDLDNLAFGCLYR